MSHRITFRTILRTGPAALVLLVAAPAALAQDRITALDAQALDWFGFDVACHGELTLVGSWRDDDAGESTGSAHLVHTPGTSPPAYIAKLTLRGMARGDLAGMHVAIGDGVLAISAPGRVLQRPGGQTIVGTVVVFEEVSGSWIQTAELDDPERSAGDLFGHSIAVGEHGILVGAPRDDGFAPDGGAVYAFERRSFGWVRTQKIQPVDNGVHDYFGHDVAVDGDSAVVGAYNDDDRGVNAGAAYALLHDGFEWTVEDKLVAAEGASFDFFGTSVAISGDTLVVGAPQNEDTDQEAVSNEGLTVVFERSLTTGRWFEAAVLRPGGPTVDHRFGIDVAVTDGTIVVGASHSDAGLLNSGAAHIFTRRGRDWFETERYVAAKPQAFDYLGLSVAASERAIVVGVPGANGTAVGTGAIDVLPTGAPRSSWAATFCHSNVRVEGFANMGGTPNPDGLLGRLSAVGSPSVARGDLGLRATNLPLGHLAAVYLGVTTGAMRVRGAEFCIGTQSLLVHYGFRAIGPDRRYVVRDPLGKLETALPGTMAPLMGETMYAQALYYDPAGGRFFTSNALSFQVEP